ncbi:MAG: hypothetical protein M5U33_00425 [Pseudorhodoplanes sp.]|nr:hypothetical protein [Pseudorhodoplanes sp.]
MWIGGDLCAGHARSPGRNSARRDSAGAGNVNAFGALIADSRYDFQRQFSGTLEDLSWDDLQQALKELSAEAEETIAAEGGSHASTLTLEPSMDVRYVGQGFELTVSLRDRTISDTSNWRAKVKRLFDELHQTQYKYHDPEGEIEVLSLRMTALRKTEVVALHAGKSRGSGSPPTTGTRTTLFPDDNEPRKAAVYHRDSFLPRSPLPGARHRRGIWLDDRDPAAVFGRGRRLGNIIISVEP